MRAHPRPISTVFANKAVAQFLLGMGSPVRWTRPDVSVILSGLLVQRMRVVRCEHCRNRFIGLVAQLVERCVEGAGVEGSIPSRSTKFAG